MIIIIWKSGRYNGVCVCVYNGSFWSIILMWFAYTAFPAQVHSSHEGNIVPMSLAHNARHRALYCSPALWVSRLLGHGQRGMQLLAARTVRIDRDRTF